MKVFSNLNMRSLVLFAAVGALIVAGPISALAVPAPQVFLTLTAQNLTGKCCFAWGDTVKVTQAATVVPVVVTWSAEYRTSQPFLVGLSVNGGACIAHGPRSIDSFSPADGTATSRTFQWLVDPSEMVKGTNTFSVCGGGVANGTDSILLGIRTLAAQVGK